MLYKFKTMRVESENNEIRITFSKDAVKLSEIQAFIDYINCREINSRSQATQEQADKIAEEINQSWWEKNKSKFE